MEKCSNLCFVSHFCCTYNNGLNVAQTIKSLLIVLVLPEVRKECVMKIMGHSNIGIHLISLSRQVKDCIGKDMSGIYICIIYPHICHSQWRMQTFTGGTLAYNRKFVLFTICRPWKLCAYSGSQVLICNYQSCIQWRFYCIQSTCVNTYSKHNTFMNTYAPVLATTIWQFCHIIWFICFITWWLTRQNRNTDSKMKIAIFGIAGSL